MEKIARIIATLVVSIAAVSTQTQAQELAGEALVSALQEGGYVLVMRHASASPDEPEPRGRAPGNINGERQLDDEGLTMVTGMRFAFRELGIPIGDALSSPAFRAVQTVRHFGFGHMRIVAELGNEDMHSEVNSERAEWLRTAAAQMPVDGTNTLIVTHAPNIVAAFGDAAAAIAAGETLIVRPDGDRGTVVGRVPIEGWPALALH